MTILKPLTVWFTANCGKLFFKRWGSQTTLIASKEICIRSRRNSQNQTWNNGLVSKWERSTSRLYTVTLLIYSNAKYIMRNAGLDETQSKIKIARRNINKFRYTDDTTLMAESKKELKSLLMKVRVKKLA